MARPKMTNQEAFDLVDTFLHKEAAASGNRGNYPFMLGYAESLLAGILVDGCCGSDPIEDLYNRMTKK